MAAVLDLLPVVDPAMDEERRLLVRTIAGYVVPRLERPEEPALIAVAGGDGVGKSHVVNRILGDQVVDEDVIRPTTTVPTLISAEGGSGAVSGPLLRKMQASAPTLDTRITDAPVAETIGLVDLPATVDEVTNTRVLGLADLVLLVVTPARYADASTWALLDQLLKRSIPVWVVLNRFGARDGEVESDLERRLREAGVAIPLYVVDEGHDGSAADLLAALDELAGEGRDALLGPSLRKRTMRVVNRTAALTFPLDEVRRSGDRLLAIADEEYDAAARAVAEMIDVEGLGPGAAAALWPDVAERLAGVVTRRVGLAAERTAAAWQVSPDGAAVLAGAGHELWRHPPETARAARDKLLDWDRELGTLVGRHTKRQLNAYKLGQVVAVVRARALGDESKPRWLVRRRLKDDLDEVAEEARARLAEIAATVVAEDKQRFIRRMGTLPSAEAIGELRDLVTAFDSDPQHEAPETPEVPEGLGALGTEDVTDTPEAQETLEGADAPEAHAAADAGEAATDA